MSTSESSLAATGVDVGADRVHAVRLVCGAGGRWGVAGCYTGPVCQDLVPLCAGVKRVAMAALVAGTGCPLPHSCARPDGSSMWLPAGAPV